MSAFSPNHVLPDIPAPCLAAMGALVGLVIGSFVTNTAVRSTRGETNLFGRSVCDHCRTPLRWNQTIPLVSFLSQGGRCRTCRAQIEPIHLWGELAGAVVLSSTASLLPLPQALAVAVLGFVLLALSLIDIQTFRLPNSIVFTVAVFCAMLAFFNGRAIVGSISALVVWGLLTCVQIILHRRLAQRVLGGGDIKLCSALALWTGLGIVYILLLASATALAVMLLTRQRGRIAFGPYLCGAGFMMGMCVESPQVHDMLPYVADILIW
ncbi:prepilin peptidase [Asticcacaulis sp. W401b]|uniref:prepilin peptidase n=1 Tax=Asticcacaulis sp. W401b TaxID=3388666 RepID=UPI003970970B